MSELSDVVDRLDELLEDVEVTTALCACGAVINGILLGYPAGLRHRILEDFVAGLQKCSNLADDWVGEQ